MFSTYESPTNTLHLEAVHVTTLCLHKVNHNNAPQAPLGRPGSTALHDTQTTTRLSSLYVQTAGENKPCKRTILLNYNIPIPRRHTIWIFHFPQPTQVNIRCPRGNKWENTDRSSLRRGHLQRHGTLHHFQQAPHTTGTTPRHSHTT
jgi:hypothetical protein